MNDIKRYRIVGGFQIEHDTGEFCEFAEHAQALAKKDQQIEQLEQTLAKKDRCYHMLVLEKHEQAAEYEKELEAASNQMQAANRQIEQWRQDGAGYLQQISQLASSLEESRRSCRAEQARADGLVVQNDRLQQKFHDAENCVPTKWWCCTADYPNHDETCPNNAEQLRTRLESLGIEAADLRQELDVAKARFDRVRSERDILQQENERLKEQLGNVTDGTVSILEQDIPVVKPLANIAFKHELTCALGMDKPGVVSVAERQIVAAIKRLMQENVTLKATISTPEVYAGMIDKVVAEERERLAKTAADMRLENERLQHNLDAAKDENKSLRAHHHDAELAFDEHTKTMTENEKLQARIADLERLLFRSADYMQATCPPRPLLVREIREALPPRACVHDPETIVGNLVRCRLCQAVRQSGTQWTKSKCEPSGDQEVLKP